MKKIFNFIKNCFTKVDTVENKVEDIKEVKKKKRYYQPKKTNK